MRVENRLGTGERSRYRNFPSRFHNVL